MWVKMLTMFVALFVALSVTTCGGGVSEEVELPRAQDIVEGVVESLDNISTFQFDMDMTMDMSGKAEGEAFGMTMLMGSSAAVDVEKREMGMNINMDMALPDEGEMEIGMEYYLINDMLYMFMEVPEIGPMWMKSETPEVYWQQMNQTESQIELLKTAQVKVIGSDRVNAVDCYVLQLNPDMEQLWQTAMQQAAVGGEEVLPDIPEEFYKDMFRNFSVKQWIAKDTYYLTKAEIDMVIELTAEAMEVEEGGFTMDITMTLFAYDYNEPVSIELPPEAREAIEVPIQ